MKAVVDKAISWPPNLPKFISLCKDINTDDAFDRLISRKPPASEVEKRTNGEVGFQCRTQLSEKDARALYSKTYLKWQERFDKGEVIEQPMLPSSSFIDKMQNGEAVRRAGEVLPGRGREHFEAMMKRIKGYEGNS